MRLSRAALAWVSVTICLVVAIPLSFAASLDASATTPLNVLEHSDAPLSPAAIAIANAALERTQHQVTYNGTYRKLAYPNGDVSASEGVCTDVVIRTYRALGIDLQQLVHEDMSAHFAAYPNHWGLSRPDSNIDHRRVPNLEAFFERAATHNSHTDNVTALSLTPSTTPTDYRPGDIVSWRLANGLPHIGVVAHKRSGPSDRYAIVHNIGRGPELDDVLFNWKIIGHYRYLPQ